jgi:hypothetical protein
MVTRGIHEYVSRDWAAARDAKDAYWADRIDRLGPMEGLRIADELRRQALAQCPGWPSQEDRREDLASHARLSSLLARVNRPGGH